MALQSQQLGAARPPILTSRRRRRRRLPRWVLPVAALTAIAGAWWLFWPRGERDAATLPSDPLVVAAAPPTPAAQTPAAQSPARSAGSTPAASATGSAPSPTATPEPRRTGEAPPRSTAPASTPAAAPPAARPAPERPAATAPAATAAPAPAAPAPTSPAPATPAPATSAPPALAATESVTLPPRTPEQRPAAPAPPRDRVGAIAATADQDPVEARAALTELILSGALTGSEQRRAREVVEQINGRLVFSAATVEGDPFSRIYRVEPGDSLERIARRETGNAVDWRFLQRINGIRNPRALQVGQRLKLPVGHFHAVVHKRDYRLDLFLVNDSGRVLVRSFPVGLGELNSTPEGVARVRAGSKLVDPAWTNPRTGEYFAGSDPANPIGHRWIGLVSVTPGDELFDTYGIHGTIDPASIGQSLSMGCIRLLPNDVELVYEVLTEAGSTVEVRP